MDTLFLITAGIGGTVIVCQFVASLLGFGGDHDHGDTAETSHDSEHGHGNLFFGLLTLRSVSAGVAFFGLGGLTARYYDLEGLPALSAACFSGIMALYLVASIMKGLIRLRHDGTARIENAVGQEATVYLKIPGGQAGPGKITVRLQNRTVECEAYSASAEIPTGSPVRIVRVIGPNRVEVEPLAV